MKNLTPYREILKSELSRRRQLDPAYSQRGFARDLSLRHNHMGQILSGDKGLSPARAHKIAAALGMTAKVATRFVDMVESEHGRSPAGRLEARQRLDRSVDNKELVLEADRFELIAS